jgi:hypothetical protein
MKLLSPWIEPHSPNGLELELQRELAPQHVLYGKAVKALAVRRDRDDVLFSIEDAVRVRYAVVHLTWTQKAEPGTCPNTTFFDSLEDWIESMRADHEDYTFGDE